MAGWVARLLPKGITMRKIILIAFVLISCSKSQDVKTDVDQIDSSAQDLSSDVTELSADASAVDVNIDATEVASDVTAVD